MGDRGTGERDGGRGALLSGLLVTILAASLCLVGCAGTRSSRPDDLPRNINEVFLDQEMDVERFVERFEGESRAVYAERFAIVEALDLTPGDVIADIGAGTGFFSFLFAEAVGRTGRVQAVEISPRFLDHLRAEAERRGLENVDVVEGTTNSVELPSGGTSIAFICDVYHHFESPADSLTSLYDAIEPGGELVLIEFHRIEGVTNEFIFRHVRAGREVFQAEIEAAGFRFENEIELDGLDDNYILRFTRP